MKKLRAIIILLASLLLITSCGKTTKENLSDMEKIQQQLLSMENYACIATVEHISNKGTKTYKMKQYYKKNGEYRLEMLEPESVNGIITTYNGKSICQYNPKVGGEIRKDLKSSVFVDEMLLGAFIRNYLKSEQTSISVAKFDSEKCTVLEAAVPGENKYLATEKLWVDNENLNPKQLIIYDVDGMERVKVIYGEFKYNAKLDEKIFNIEQ
jgi:outer membrane lipoprotein-sorting protein